MSDNDEAQGPMHVDAGLVRQLAELLNEGDLSEIEVQDGKRRIVVKRKLAAATTYAAAASPRHADQAASVAAPTVGDDAEVANAVTSPMVGTAYLAAEPGAKPFVAVGDRVSAGDTLLIVEAMKVMNAIPAPRAGTVRQVLVQSAQPVEYDQPLMIIE